MSIVQQLTLQNLGSLLQTLLQYQRLLSGMFWLTKSITWHYVGWNLLSCFLLVLQSFLGVSRGPRRVLNRTLHVSVDSDWKLFKTFWSQKEFRKLVWPQKVVCDIKRVFTCSPSLPGSRPRQRCPWTSRATPWSTTPASQTSRALKSVLTTMINFS